MAENLQEKPQFLSKKVMIDSAVATLKAGNVQFALIALEGSNIVPVFNAPNLLTIGGLLAFGSGFLSRCVQEALQPCEVEKQEIRSEK